MRINPNIFRTYDIRGVADRDLTDEVVYLLGKAYGTHITHHSPLTTRHSPDIAVARDVRLSSKRIRDVLVRGLIDSGMNVTDYGVVPTPLLYFSLFHYKQDGGIMITGSHNPKEYNGFKICKGKETIYGDEIQKLREIIEKGEFAKGKGDSPRGKIIAPENIVEDYISLVKSKIEIKRPKKVILDPGNGVAGPIAKRLFSDFDSLFECIYCEPDGNFPNHLPDPTIPEFMEDLRKRVINNACDFGVGYDGDGDRLGVIDDKGNIIWGDKLLCLYSKEILQTKPGASIIFEVKCSDGLIEYIKAHGGNPLMWKTGHSLIKAKMRETGAPLAGEMSGHMFFADNYYGYDDAIFASLRLLKILSEEERPLSEIVNEIPYYYSTPEIRIDTPDEDKFNIVEKLKSHFKKEYEVIDIDGARIKFKDGWGLVRASNTQPVLVLRFEGKTEKALEKIKSKVMGKLKELQ